MWWYSLYSRKDVITSKLDWMQQLQKGFCLVVTTGFFCQFFGWDWRKLKHKSLGTFF
jgi:hypothetical protein